MTQIPEMFSTARGSGWRFVGPLRLSRSEPDKRANPLLADAEHRARQPAEQQEHAYAW